MARPLQTWPASLPLRLFRRRKILIRSILCFDHRKTVKNGQCAAIDRACDIIPAKTFGFGRCCALFFFSL